MYPTDLFCLLGPEFGFNRHLLLFSPTVGEAPLEWGLPWREVVEKLFLMLDLPFVEKRMDVIEYGERKVSPAPSAPTIALRALILPEVRFAEFMARMRIREVTRFKVVEYRAATGKVSDIDWLSDGVLRYVFDRLHK